MSKRQVIVKVSSLEESLAKFKDIWARAERGEKLKTPIEIFSFEKATTLMKALSPKRLALLQLLHELGKVSIRQLAKQLDRDYSNVHEDVRVLTQIGMILKDKMGKYYVPWDTIVTEIPLCTERSSRHHVHYGRTAIASVHKH